MGFPDGSAGKESTCNAGDTEFIGSNPGSGTSPEWGKWQPTPSFLPEKPHGQRSLAGYSPQDHKESDTTEPLSRNTHKTIHMGVNLTKRVYDL